MAGHAHTTTHILNDGLAISLRPIRPDDKGKLATAFKKLSYSSIFTRFFAPKTAPTEADLEAATDIDFNSEVAIVATLGIDDAETIVGVGRYVRPGGHASADHAEVAFAVAEDYRGLGIASLLLKELVRIARAKGVRRLEADVLARNTPMLKAFVRCGLPILKRSDGGVVHIVLELGTDD